METIKSRTKLMEDGSLVVQGAVEDGYIGGYVSDPEWAARLKTWRQLNKLGRFVDVAKQAGVPVSTIEDAARYGNYDDKCEETDWGSIQAAIDVLTGRAKRRAKLRRARQKAGERVLTQRSRRKVATLLNEIQAADFVVFPTEILNSSMIEEDEGGDEMQDGLAIVSPEYTPPAVEYWEPPARRQRARTAAALRVARHRKRKNDASS